MAKKIIILERLENDLSFTAAFWASVPSARWGLYANPDATSSYKGATVLEIQDIKDGKVVEKVENYHYASGTSVAVIQTDLINKFNDYQSKVNNFNQFQQYGRFWDGSSWTAGGVS